MKATVIGISEPMSFSAEDGTQIEGVTIHYAYKMDRVAGQAVGSKFIFSRMLNTIPDGLAAGDVVSLDFNEKGRLAGIDLLTPATPFADDPPPNKTK